MAGIQNPHYEFFDPKSHTALELIFLGLQVHVPLTWRTPKSQRFQTNFKKVISIPGWWEFWPTPPFFDFFRLFSGFLISLALIVHFFKLVIEGFSWK